MNQHKQSSDLDLGRGWLTRAAAALEAWQSRVAPQSSAALLDSPEFARAAAEIGNGFVQLAAVEREAAAQAFVDERHAVERAEDLERIAANRAEDLERIAAADAKAWEHQDSEAEVRDAVVEAHRAMTARMQAEQAEVEQRASALAALDVAALAASGQREQRAEAEARPHDDELVPCDQPDGIANDSHDLPGPARAAERVNAFLAWWGDGQIGEGVLGVGPPLFARDLQALTNAAVDRG